MIKTIAESLTDMKKDVGLSNRKLADLSGVPEGTVNKILSGNTAKPSHEDVEKMVRAMGRSMDELLGEPETPKQVQTAVLDHYALLIESLKEQISGLKEQLIAKDAEHRVHTASHRKALWALFILLVIMMIFLGYLCIDVLHGDWGMIQYPR